MAFYPTFELDYILKMPKSEYFMRLRGHELRTAHERLEHVNYSLDDRTIINDTRKISDEQIAFNITHPYQQFDYQYFEDLLFNADKAKPSEESKTPQQLEKEERERFNKIQKEVEEKYRREEH